MKVYKDMHIDHEITVGEFRKLLSKMPQDDPISFNMQDEDNEDNMALGNGHIIISRDPDNTDEYYEDMPKYKCTLIWSIGKFSIRK